MNKKQFFYNKKNYFLSHSWTINIFLFFIIIIFFLIIKKKSKKFLIFLPVFSTFKIFLTQATISWDEGFAGLSRLITPYFKCSTIGRVNGEKPFGIGVKW